MGESFVDRPLWAKLGGICVLCEWSLQGDLSSSGFYQSNAYAGLSPANPVISQWTHGHGDHGGEAGAEVWTQQQDPHSPRLIGLQAAAWRPTLSTLPGPAPSVSSQLPGEGRPLPGDQHGAPCLGSSQRQQPASGGRLITPDCCHHKRDRLSL